MSETAAACLAIEEDLSALIDEELAPEREAELREHLGTCDRCARRLEELCNVDLVLASLPAPEVRSNLRAQLAQRLAEHEPGEAAPARAAGRPRRSPPPRARRWLGRRAAALAAVAAAALLAVLVTLRSGEAPEPAAPQIAGPAPQALPAPGPRPGAEQRGEPLLAEQRSLEPEPAQPEAARVELAEVAPPAPEAASVEIADAGLEDLSEEDLALLLVLDEVEDLDVIANLELLEDLRELEGMEGAG